MKVGTGIAGALVKPQCLGTPQELTGYRGRQMGPTSCWCKDNIANKQERGKGWVRDGLDHRTGLALEDLLEEAG